MKEKPRFYCDSCGSEVPQDARECPKCGRSFASVRCPVCGFTGEVAVFDDGCPGCGYSAPAEEKNEKEGKKKKGKKAESKIPRKQQESAFNVLPLWVYLVTGAVFAGVLVMLYFAVLSV